MAALLLRAALAGAELESGFVLEHDQHALSPPPAGCMAMPGVSYGGDDLFGGPHGGMKLADNPGQCCALCHSFTNCTFWTYAFDGTTAKPTCYGAPGGCCVLQGSTAKPASAP